MLEITSAMAAAGVAVTRVPLDLGHDDGEHERRLRAALEPPVVVGGFSVGARIAVRLWPELGTELEPAGLLLFGFPFHRARDATARHGLEALRKVQAPTLVVQGTRDRHGSEADVRGYGLPPSVEVLWLRDGNHRFAPRQRSGLTHEAHIEAAVAAALAFLRAR